MSPNVKPIRLAEYPGDKNMNISPIAMPNDHSIAMALSGLIFDFLSSMSIDRAVVTANRNAPISGLMPK